MNTKRCAISNVLGCVLVLGVALSLAAAEQGDGRPNVVIIFCDDLGYGDVGCFGASEWRTPNIDRMAQEGIRFTRFYDASPVCSASRAALLTGCYPSRVGIHGALFPDSTIGLNPREVTIAEVLKPRGYATAIFGKWHLGFQPEFLPTRQGFDEYFGLPYSNDMWPWYPASEGQPRRRRDGYPDLRLLEGELTAVSCVTGHEQNHLTTWYAERAVKFIERNKSQPFFLYFAHTMPHTPLHVSTKFKGKSQQGLYGDVIEEIDWTVGRVLTALKENSLDTNTLVIFTSDNGPWLQYGNHAGRAGPLREGKNTCWEGGVRVPFIARWPGQIPAGVVCEQPAMTIDLLPTIAKLTGARLSGHKIDGLSIVPLLKHQAGAKSPHKAYFFYYADNQLQALTSGRWKLQLPHAYHTLDGKPPGRDGLPAYGIEVKIERPQLFDLEQDIGESTDVAAQHPNVVKRLLRHAEQARRELGDSLTQRVGKGVREPGHIVVSGPRNEPI